jgi:hypothetical protein
LIENRPQSKRVGNKQKNKVINTTFCPFPFVHRLLRGLGSGIFGCVFGGFVWVVSVLLFAVLGVVSGRFLPLFVAVF